MGYPALDFPEWEGAGVLACAPVAAYSEAQAVLLEDWDKDRLRIVWKVGTLAQPVDYASHEFTQAGPDYDSAVDAHRAFAVALLEGFKA